ncbi:MAG: long-chain fatty acid--CoA ligase [Gammaproteobacteria bacterium]|nr:long-chain fatty acid--CoA ligase [Gammaproteobacteria bacterium]
MASARGTDVITRTDALTLDELFRERVRRSADAIAYSQFDADQGAWVSCTWAEMAQQVSRWQSAFAAQRLHKGDRVAICHSNSMQWVCFDQAALRLGLVVVPLYPIDRAENTAFVISDAHAKLAFFESHEQWQHVAACEHYLGTLKTVLVPNMEDKAEPDSRVRLLSDWLPAEGERLERGLIGTDDLASIVYTSGTTGAPKGVMLSHRNILANAYSSLRSVVLKPEDHLLSFLPLSHTLERTLGYVAPMMAGARVTFNRSIPDLAEDLKLVKPTAMLAVPRIFERVHNQIYAFVNDSHTLRRWLFKLAINVGWQKFLYSQGLAAWRPRLLLSNLLDGLVASNLRATFGGRLQYSIVGGAPLSLEVMKTFTALGIPLVQGYGLTEASPAVSSNTLERNLPGSIGLPLRGVQVRIGNNDELLVKGESVMRGYWQNPDATEDIMSGEWLHTGDQARIDDAGFIFLTGRIKEIMVLSNGEKVAPALIEAAIARDPLIEQVMLVGEAKPFLTAIVVLNPAEWRKRCKKIGLADERLSSATAQNYLLKVVASQMTEAPGHAQVRQVYPSFVEWSIESGLLTRTYKVQREQVLAHFAEEIHEMYKGHEVYKA